MMLGRIAWVCRTFSYLSLNRLRANSVNDSSVCIVLIFRRFGASSLIPTDFHYMHGRAVCHWSGPSNQNFPWTT